MMMHRVMPDRSSSGSPKDIEARFGIKFAGTGFYLTESTTLLVTADAEEHGVVTQFYPWERVSERRRVFYAYLFECNFRDTIFAVSATAPCRLDKRSMPVRHPLPT